MNKIALISAAAAAAAAAANHYAPAACFVGINWILVVVHLGRNVVTFDVREP